MFTISYITSQNPIRYNIDTLSSRKYGLIASNSADIINLSRASRVTGITVTGSQPAGTAVYFAFRVNNTWGKLTASGTFQPFTGSAVSFSTLESYGNTPAQLKALSDVPALAGKSFGIAAALSADDPTKAVPSCSLSFSCVSDSQVLTAEEYSPVYELGENSQIIRLESESESSNGGEVLVTARITRPDGTVSNWAALDSLAGAKAEAVQFKGEYKAATPGVSKAQILSAGVLYSDGSSIVSGVSSGEIISLTQDWYMPVKSCRLTIKHSPLVSSVMNAFITLRSSPQRAAAERLGIGTGGRKVFQLASAKGIKYDSFRLYFDNTRVFSEYELNCQAGRVTCEAPEGVIVSCSYEYGWDLEEWHEMALSSRLSYEDYDLSEYRFSTSEEGRSVAALKIVIGITSGSIVNERLGTSTGLQQSYMLAKRIDDGRITVTADNQALDRRYWTLLEDPQHISIAAPAGKLLRASYDWVSETPKVYQYSAVYSD